MRRIGDNTRATAMAFAAGDEIIFGENVALATRTLRNNDLARIVAIDATDAANPLLWFRMEDGQEVGARYAALVGRREDGEIAAPRMQHSYAMTAHSSQGATYARTVELALEGHGREAALVASTRHRIDHVKVVATDRLADSLEAKRAATLELGRGGVIRRGPEDDDERESTAAPTTPAAPPPMPPLPRLRRRPADPAAQERQRQDNKAQEAREARVELEEIKAAYFRECAAHDQFGNVSDFHGDIYEFAGVERPKPPRPAAIPAPMPAPLLERRIEAVAKQTVALRFGQPIGEPSPTPQPAKAPSIAQPTRLRVTQDERDQMRQVNLIDFAIDRLGGRLVEEWGRGESAHVAFGELGVVAITHKDGWIWSPKQGGKGGVIYDLVARVRGPPYGEALDWLRQELRTERPRAPEPAARAAVQAKAITPHVLSEDARRRIVSWWENLKTIGDHAQRWLVERRGIPADALARFNANVRGEPSGPKAQNRFGSAFVHRDEDLRLTTLVRRGPDGFSSYAKDTVRGLFQAGELTHPKRVYVTETSIDTLSLFAFDRQPEGAALLSSDGSFHERAREIVARRAREWPGAEWHVGQDNDEPRIDRATVESYVHGRRHRDAVIAAIREGDPSATIIIRDPDEGCGPGETYKDWNDRLRGPGFAKGASAARREAKREAEQDVARLAVKETARLAAEPNRPKPR